MKERKDGALKKISSGVDKFLEELSKIGKLLTYNQLFGWFFIKSCMYKAVCMYILKMFLGFSSKECDF